VSRFRVLSAFKSGEEGKVRICTLLNSKQTGVIQTCHSDRLVKMLVWEPAGLGFETCSMRFSCFCFISDLQTTTLVLEV
jgi:hypothetical protein